MLLDPYDHSRKNKNKRDVLCSKSRGDELGVYGPLFLHMNQTSSTGHTLQSWRSYIKNGLTVSL